MNVKLNMNTLNCVLIVVVLVLVVMCCCKKETFGVKRIKCYSDKNRYCGEYGANSWEGVSDKSVCYKDSDEAKPIDACKRHREARISKTKQWFKDHLPQRGMLREQGSIAIYAGPTSPVPEQSVISAVRPRPRPRPMARSAGKRRQSLDRKKRKSLRKIRRKIRRNRR